MANDEITYDKQGRMSQEDEKMWTKPSQSPQVTPQKVSRVIANLLRFDRDYFEDSLGELCTLIVRLVCNVMCPQQRDRDVLCPSIFYFDTAPF